VHLWFNKQEGQLKMQAERPAGTGSGGAGAGAALKPDSEPVASFSIASVTKVGAFAPAGSGRR
jgi:hypothetical protein